MLLPQVLSGRLIRFRSVAAAFILSTVAITLCLSASLRAQSQLPYMNAGQHSTFGQVDFGQFTVNQEIWRSKSPSTDGAPADSGTVSILDLSAPNKAVQEFKRANSAFKAQNPKEAIKCLQKAVEIYPQFVSAHNALGLAYLDQHDPRAREEFQTAAKLDDNFAVSFLNLGMLALSSNDFENADVNLAKAASLAPDDPRILAALAFAQNGHHKYLESLHTAERVHALDHRGMANVHYIAASDALSLRDIPTAERELQNLVTEDPANPLAPIARKRLADFSQPHIEALPVERPHIVAEDSPTRTTHTYTFPNSDHLRLQLDGVNISAADTDSESKDCSICIVSDPAIEVAETVSHAPVDNPPTVDNRDGLYTLRQSVDETALFFSVTRHGKMVDSLSLADIQLRDDERPPQQIVDFVPQSKLPLRLGLLIDVSDSVDRRFSFEKHAAERFVRRVLNKSSDLAFVGGFNGELHVSQDFTNDPEALVAGVEKLKSTGETSLFDALHLACWKLAAYPDDGRVARVLVVLTDGEDNSSHRSLMQAIEEAEASGVTVYTVSTSEGDNTDTYASKILQTVAERSGGDSIFPGSLRALDHFFDKLRDVIRSRYLIAYKAAGFAPNGKFRRIKVTAQMGGEHLQVHVRKGYYARLADNPTRLAENRKP